MTHSSAKCVDCGVTRAETKLFGSLAQPDRCATCLDAHIATKPVAVLVSLPGEGDHDLSRIIQRLAGRKMNIESAEPDHRPTGLKTISHGRYSSRCTWERVTYEPRIKNYADLSADSRTITVHSDLLEKSITVRAPRGYEWREIDDRLALIRLADGSEYHPDTRELERGARYVRERLLENRAARIESDRRARQQKLEEKTILANLNSIPVTFADSRRAGNCHAGTTRFAQQLGLSGQLDHATVSADRIMRLAERTGQQELAWRAVRAAWERITEIAI